MKAFITGGTGYVGSFLVRHLSQVGYELTVLARDPRSSPELAALPRVHLLEGDIQNLDHLEPYLRGQDALIHNALIWRNSDSELGHADAVASARLFERAANLNVLQILYTSSTAVHRPFGPRMDEQTVVEPVEAYGVTKRISELSLLAITSERMIRANIIRLGPVIGQTAFPNGRLKSDRRLESIVKAAVEGRDIPISTNAGRQFISGAQVAKLYQAVLESEVQQETYIAVNGKNHLRVVSPNNVG